MLKKIKKLVSKDSFKDSEHYWNKRYNSGGDSGRGSYNMLAEFKSKVINDFVDENNIKTVIELGCGDGNQLKYYDFKKYIGLDVSLKAINICKNLFKDDESKKFDLISNYKFQKAELSMSIDVIYHLVEDDVFKKHIDLLFNSSDKYVIIYSSNSENINKETQPHVRHRNFSTWVEDLYPEFELLKILKNQYPFSSKKNTEGSHADFYFYKKK